MKHEDLKRRLREHPDWIWVEPCNGGDSVIPGWYTQIGSAVVWLNMSYDCAPMVYVSSIHVIYDKIVMYLCGERFDKAEEAKNWVTKERVLEAIEKYDRHKMEELL